MLIFRIFACLLFLTAACRAGTLDTLVLGDPVSENAHGLAAGWGPFAPASYVAPTSLPSPSDPSLTPPSDVVVGGLGRTARRLLPRTPNADIYGGEISFTMAVDPVRQNYVTAKFWGSDTSTGIWLILNVDGFELGLRHGGNSAAPDMFFGNKQIVTFAPERWVYRTVAIPLHLTKGKTSLSLKIRSMGWISDYDGGPYFGAYNKLMNSPSLSLYRLYTHVGSKLDVAGETQGAGKGTIPLRATDDETTTIAGLKTGVNNRLSTYLGTAVSSLQPWQLAWLAKAHDARENLGESWISYGGANTAATLVQKVIDGIDYHVARQSAAAGYVASFGNGSWGGGFGPLGETIMLLWPQINTGATMTDIVAYGGDYGSVSRTTAWSRALRASVDHGRYNRRGGPYANQDIIGAEHTYLANRGLLLVDPANALLETEALRYLKEAAGLLPWAGSDRSGGGAVPVKGTYPHGTNFYSVTTDGTTKDGGGFVGSDYGEMGSPVVNWGLITGNQDLLNRGLQMLRARANFRFPSFDANGYRIMEAANPIGVRNRTLPGHYAYLTTNDSGGTFVAALGPSVIGADLLGYYQQGVAEGQQLGRLSNTDPYVVRNWTLAKSYAATNVPLPMAVGAPDFAWADKENMVVAAKSGENRIFVNLNWASPASVNGWAKIFHLPDGAAPELAEVQVDDVRYRPSGTFETLGSLVEANGLRQPFDNPVGTYNGVVLPRALSSDLSSLPSGNLDTGKGTGYTLRYGHWLIGINAHHADTYDLLLPSNFSTALPIKELVSGATLNTTTVTLAPKSAAVFYLPDVVDPAPRPARPLTLTAASTASAIVLDWEESAGAAAYRIKRSTVSGSGYTVIATTAASSWTDATAAAGTTYYYTVVAINAAGLEGGAAPEVTTSLKPAGLLNRASGGAAAASLASGSYPAANAFDGNTSTKWNSGSTGVAAALRYDFGPRITWAVTRYDLTSADTTLRDPAAWTLEGSNDGSAWTVLDTRSGETFSARVQTKTYTLANTTGYRHYRLNITAASGGLGYEVQLAELALYASAPGTVPASPAPGGLTATSGDNQILLRWNAVASATGYVVKRATSASGPYATLATTDNLYFQDTTAPSTGTYYYIVCSANPGGEGPATAPVSAAFGPAAPLAPGGLTAASGPNTGNITLRWNAAPGVPSYTVKRASASGGPYTTIATGLTDTVFTDTGRANDTAVYYIVTSVVGGLESPPSAEVSVPPRTYSWIGTTAAWGTAANWGGTAPGNGSLLVFSGTPSVLSTNNNLSALSVAGIVFNSGASAHTLAGNALVLDGDITDYAAATQTISLGLTLSANRTIDVVAGQLTIGGVITDGAASYSLTKNGAGTLALTAANTFDGGLNVTAGTLQIGTSTSTAASGSVTGPGPAGTTVTLGNATLRFQMGSGSDNTFAQNYVFNTNTTVSSNDGLITLGTSATTVAFNGTTLLRPIWSNKWLVIAGAPTGSGDISILNTASTHVTAVAFTHGSGTYDGTLTVENAGTGMAALAIGHDNAFRHARINALNTQSGRYPVWFVTTSPVVGGLEGAPGANILLNTAGGLHGNGPSTANPAVTLSVGYDDSDSLYEGNLSGTGGLAKIGSGLLSLAGVNTYSGSTTVSGGTLLLLSDLGGAGDVTAASGGRLAGEAAIAGTLVGASGGVISPGSGGIGVLSPRALRLDTGALLDFDIGTPAASDRLALTGGAYTGPVSGRATLRLSPADGFGPGTYPLVTGAAGISPAHFTLGTAAPAGYAYALSAAGDTLNLVVTGPPPAPAGLLARGHDGAISLAWEPAPGATGYNLYISASPASGFTLLASTTTATTYLATGLANGTPRYFYIVATNANGAGPASSVVSATPQAAAWVASPTSLDWSLAANWGGTAPLANTRLVFGSSSATNLNNDLLGHSVGGLLFNSGASAYTLSGNSVGLTGDIVNNSTATQTINFALTLAGTRTVTANTGAVILNGSIDDSGRGYGLIKNGSGSLTLAGANAFSGGITLDAGTLYLNSSSAAGSGPLVLNAGTVQLNGAVVHGTVSVPSGATVSLVKASGTSYLYGGLSGSGTLNESGAGSLQLNGDNSGFSGTITSANTSSAARWRFNNAAAGSAAAAWNLNCTAIDAYGFNLNTPGTVYFGSLSGSGSLRNNGTGMPTLRVGDLGTSTTFSGSTIFNLALLKVGAGTWTLTNGSLQHYGPTTAAAGVLNMNGTLVSSTLAVQSGATLTGTGILGGTVNIAPGGTLAPGNGPTGIGTLLINGTYAPAAGSVLSFQLGTASDQLALGIGSNYTAPSSGVVYIDLAAATGFSTGTYTLITNAGSGTLSANRYALRSTPTNYHGTLFVEDGALKVTLRTALATWSGATSGAWTLAANWGGALPQNGDYLAFGTSANTTLSSGLASLAVSRILFNSGAPAFTLGGNALILGGDIVNNSTAAQTLSLPLVLSRDIAVNTNTGAVPLSGVVSGPFALSKTGTGTLNLTAANTFSGGYATGAGDTYISGAGAGAAGAPTSGALGTGVVTLAGGRLLYGGATTSLYNNLVARAATTTTILETAAYPLYLYGSLTGSGNVVLDANANYNGIRLAGDNSGYTGTLTLASTGNSARHKFDNAAAGSAAAKWILNGPTDSGSFAFGTGTIHFGELSGAAAQIRNNSGGSTIATVSVGALNTDSTFSGVFSSVGTIALRKVGTGTLTLSGANSYTGLTEINGGTLKFLNAKSGSGAITVNSAATLAGTATLAGVTTVKTGGVIAPGNNGAGTLTLGGLTLEPGSGLVLELGAVASSDKITLTGAYTPPATGVVTLDIAALSGFGPGSYPLITGATGIAADRYYLRSVPAGNYVYTLSAADGALTLDVAAWTALETWRSARFGTIDATGTAADSADPDADGIPNLLEYALATDPLSAEPAEPIDVQVSSGRLVLHFERLAPPPVAYVVEASGDLVNWTEIATLASGASAWTGPANVVETGSGDTRQTAVEDTAIISAATPRFLRLRAGGLSRGTVPRGGLVLDLPASATAAVSLPLDAPPLARGPVLSVGQASVSLATAGDWASPAAPHALRLLSGSLSGATFIVSAVSGQTVALAVPAGLDLRTLVAPGDTCVILPIDTLGSLFGAATTPFKTGASATTADNIQLWNGSVWSVYYHNGSQWRRSGSPASQNNTPIHPDAGLLVVRRAESLLSLSVTGRVHEVAPRQFVAPGERAFLASPHPLATTLAATGFTATQGWRTGSSAAEADTLQLRDGTIWLSYYHNGTNWRRAGSPVSQNTRPLLPTQPVMILRPAATGPATSFILHPLPYIP